MVHYGPRLRVVFYRSGTGREPVREWLKGLTKDARTDIGRDIRVVQIKWPVGMPLVRFLGKGLLELQTPKRDLQLARQRAAQWHVGGSIP